LGVVVLRHGDRLEKRTSLTLADRLPYAVIDFVEWISGKTRQPLSSRLMATIGRS
jgi:hypothetical protein